MAHEELKARSQAVWNAGEYRPTGRRLAPASDALLDALDLRPGMRLLDVAAGDGNCAIAAAQRGAGVIATDFSPVQVERGRTRSAQAGADISWQQADAADLPFAEGTFDRVTSVFGAIFAPEQEAVAAELTRVARPGGRVGMTAWVADGLTARLQQLTREVMPPEGSAPPPDPFRWGDADHVRHLFRTQGCTDVAISEHVLTFRFPSWAAQREESQLHGLAVVMRETLGEDVYADLQDRQQALMRQAGRDEDGGVAFDSSYLIIVAMRD